MANNVDLGLVAALLRGLSKIVGIMNPSIGRAVEFAATALELPGEVNPRLKAINDMVQKMVDQNRPPESQEVSDLHALIDETSRAIQDTAARKEAGSPAGSNPASNSPPE